ncbi:DNA polymerase subunit Cdc27 [Auriculariales sp. MPI-PUGE-AT-0066]|nr:DNA polymerase subunit Cdc27 [Auriculariales sp. MPI-PUGE-AT-0066]
MSTSQIQDLLDRLLLADQNIVTHRRVARELNIDASSAKSALETYHHSSNGKTWATYLVAGESEDGHRQFVLAPQDSLDDAKQQLPTITSIQVYSLSVSSLKDSSMVALAARQERVDSNKANPIKLRVTNPAAAPPKPTAAVKVEPKKEEKSRVKSGTLDFSKAKAKDDKAAAATSTAQVAPTKVVKKESTSSDRKQASKQTDSGRAKTTNSSTTTKASAPLVLKTESRSASRASQREADEVIEDVAMEDAPTISTSRKGRVVYSDDEDQDSEVVDKSRHSVTSSSALTTRRKRKVVHSDDEDDSMSMDSAGADMYEDTEPEIKPMRKKKAMKTGAPVGSNGRPKKRIVKERFTTDKDGFMVTQDYSEYETDDAATPPPESKPTLDEAKSKPAAKPVPKAEAQKPKPKPAKAAAAPAKAGQQKLGNFFGKK